LIGQFDLVGIRPAPRGVPQVEVTSDIDATASSTSRPRTRARQGAADPLPGLGGLPTPTSDKMVNEAEEFAEEDKSAATPPSRRTRPKA